MLRFAPDARPAAEYRRKARQLRCRLAADPAAKQWALRELAKAADAIAPPRGPIVSLVPEEVTVRRLPFDEPAEANADVRDFARAVAIELDAPVLRYSRRQALLRQAEGLGISRFDANLLIAAVQHRLGSEKPVTPQIESARSINWETIGIAACVLVLQTVIVAGAVMILR